MQSDWSRPTAFWPIPQEPDFSQIWDMNKNTANTINFHYKPNSEKIKVVSTTFLLVCFLSLKESTCEIRTNVFLFNFKSSFRSQENQILDFWILKFYDVIKCLIIKQEIHFTK